MKNQKENANSMSKLKMMQRDYLSTCLTMIGEDNKLLAIVSFTCFYRKIANKLFHLEYY
jgi:hypothetical protein